MFFQKEQEINLYKAIYLAKLWERSARRSSK